MKCSCTIEIDINDSPELLSNHTQTARKLHKCTECGRVISIGEKYEKTTGLWSGVWDAFKTCVDCLSLRCVFFPHNGFVFGEIRGDIHQNISDNQGDIPEDCISELTPAAREFVCDAIERTWVPI